MRAMVLLVFLFGCASFRGGAPIAPVAREPVFGMGRSVIIVVRDGNFSPYCSPVMDAANDITCEFYYGWFEAGGLITSGKEAYRYMTQVDARSACGKAMWSFVFSLGDREACTRGLMQYRYMNDADYGEKEPTGGE